LSADGSPPVHPTRRIAPAVIHRKHNDPVGLDDVKNAVGKSVEEMTSNVAVNHCRRIRKLRDGFESFVNSIQKVLA
jgi:hypothetical protein